MGKYVTAAEAVKVVKSNDRVYVQAAAAHSAQLIHLLQAQRLVPCRLALIHPLSPQLQLQQDGLL